MKKLILLITVSFFCVTANAQVPQQPADTLIKKLDSLEKKTDSLGFQNNNIKENAYNETTRLRTRDYFILLGSNIKQQFTKPFHMRKKDWINLGKFATVAVSVGIFDERIQKNAVSLRNNSGLVRNTGKYISLSGGTNEVFTLAAFGLYGVITKNEKVKTKPAPSDKFGLTERELLILKMIAQEMSNDEIAGRLNVSKRTIDSHRQNLLYKLNAKNTAGLVKAAYLLKLI